MKTTDSHRKRLKELFGEEAAARKEQKTGRALCGRENKESLKQSK